MDSQVIGEAIGRVIGVLLVVALFWVVPITCGIRQARRKGRSPHWMWFGIHPVGGWIAFIVLASVAALRTCPECAERVAERAKLCPYCGERFEKASTATPLAA